MKIAIIPDIKGTSGPASFRRRLEHGWQGGVVAAESDPEVALIIGGTRRLASLRSLSRRGVPLVQRLDGMNWMHRRARTGLRHYLKAELGNGLLRLIRSRYARHVVYQSEFARGWWNDAHGSVDAGESVVYNGVPLDTFSPVPDRETTAAGYRVLILEGRFEGGYEVGLRACFDMLRELESRVDRPIELRVVGQVPRSVRQEHGQAPFRVEWMGSLPHEQVPGELRQADLLLSSDLNPACPNSVIEALACGTPVVGYDTGAMAELVQGDSGRLAPYGSDPWKLEHPDIGALAERAQEVLEGGERFRAAARAIAEQAFGVGRMVEGYHRAFQQALEAAA